MADKNLFPVFEMPLVMPEEQKTSTIKYGRSWKFDFELGDFVMDGGNKVKEADGHTAWAQWCMKTLLTERGSCLAYSDAIGIESDEVRKQPSRKAAESVLERTVTEALLADPRTDSVRDFKFTWTGDNVYASFTVYPKIGAPEKMGVTIKL
ncbi:MAG: DUF2634 domain-containing protein [Firmicutes bacterium]|nr:DUF2634 domain-containing protein [Bacillota bacterium]